jgi:hypothetical protein
MARISADDAANHSKKYFKPRRNDTTRSATFSKADLEEIMNQPGFNGLRVVLGTNDANQVVPIIHGVDENNQLMTEVMHVSVQPCPPDCPPTS